MEARFRVLLPAGFVTAYWWLILLVLAAISAGVALSGIRRQTILGDCVSAQRDTTFGSNGRLRTPRMKLVFMSFGSPATKSGI